MSDRSADLLREMALIDRVLAHEERTGYRDVSTSGGLSRFIGERAGNLMSAVSDDGQQLLREIDGVADRYAELSADGRRAAVEECRRLIASLVRNREVPVTPTHAPVPAARPTVQPRATRSSGRVAAPQRTAPRIASLADSVRLLPGVGESRAKLLEALGVTTVGDLLRLYPRRHIDYGNLQKIGSLLFGGVCTIQGEVAAVEETRTRTGKALVDVVVRDDTGAIHAIWFNPYIARSLSIGSRVSLSGRVEQSRGSLCLMSPEWEPLESDLLHTGRLTPVYPLTKNLYQKSLRPIVRSALEAGLPLVDEYLPPDLLEDEQLIGLRDALAWVHFPEGEAPGEAQRRLEAARKRLAFDEFLTLQLGLLRRKMAWAAQPGNAIAVDFDVVARFVRSLPFEITRAQRRALKEILDGLAAARPMTRMLQGDVGSGKTVVAAAAMVAAVQAGYQTAIMAPTEILAEQHYRSFERLFSSLPDDLRPRVGFLTGAVGGAERSAIYEGIRDGTIDLLIGTHALIQLGVEFARLGFVVIDEQHRFGVEQRAALRSKGRNADVLIMTATPIPRTLALTLHGDLDVSTLDELPPGRQSIETRWLRGRERHRAYAFIRDQVERGCQAFIIVPLVEESEAIDAKAAVAEYERLQRDVFPDLPLGLLHGRMKSIEKDAVMASFRDGTIAVLVATSVVEVGIDVPNATVMLVDGAERFGLAQLHQFRGRVGRGSAKSYCLLLADDVSGDGRQRLQALVDSQDGFYLAQVDLELRGPGDFLGTRQSGLPEIQLAGLADVRDLERARMAAERVLAEDPELASAKYALLAVRVDAFWRGAAADVH